MSTIKSKQILKNKTFKHKKSKNYYVAIPSYDRSDVLEKKTLSTLIDGKVDPKKIFIFVANKEEEKKYKDAIDPTKYNKIVVGVKGISEQRKFIVKYFKEGDYVVSVDDDVEGLYAGYNNKMSRIHNIDQFIKDAFVKLEKEHLYLWGIYPVFNPFFMKNNISTGLKFIIGVMRGFINRKSADLEPSSKIKEKEDYHQSILYYLKDGGVLRFNNVAPKTKFHADGGLGNNKERFENNKIAAEFLQEMYPDLVTIFHRKNGMTEIRLANKKRI
jgi:hypothetical protein